MWELRLKQRPVVNDIKIPIQLPQLLWSRENCDNHFFMKWNIYNKCSIFYRITEFIKGIFQTNINKLHRIDGWKLLCFLIRVWFWQNYRKVKAETIFISVLIWDLISAVSLLTNNCFRYTNHDLLTSIVTSVEVVDQREMLWIVFYEKNPTSLLFIIYLSLIYTAYTLLHVMWLINNCCTFCVNTVPFCIHEILKNENHNN